MSGPGPEFGTRYKTGDHIVSRVGMRGIVVRDLTAEQNGVPSYRVRWATGYESVARPGYVILRKVER